MMSVWKKTIEKKVCPWITQEVEYKIQNKGPSAADRIRMLRLGMFYVVVKNFLYKFSPKKLAKTLKTYNFNMNNDNEGNEE